MNKTSKTLSALLTATSIAGCSAPPIDNNGLIFEFNTTEPNYVVYEHEIPKHNSLCFLIDKSDANMQVYKANSCDELGELLLETPIVHGGKNKVREGGSKYFPTPVGDYYIQSKMKGPITYYPPSHDPNPNPRPGAQTHTLLPFTKAVIEPKRYGFLPGQEEGVSTMLAIHGSKDQNQFNLPKEKRKLSHGCIRTPDTALDKILQIIANTANVAEGPFSNMKSKSVVTYNIPFHVRIKN